MKLTVITCTYQRPEAMELCREYMKAQTRQPDQWLILDGPEPMRQKIKQAATSGAIQGDAVAFWEDDDFVRPDWLAWCAEQIENGYDLAGEGLMVYHNVGKRWCMECQNTRHAALCATVISTKFLEELVNVIDCEETPFFDRRLWHLDVNKRLFLPKSAADHMVVGIKGMPGTKGYSEEHGDMPDWGYHDPGLVRLCSYVGLERAKRYARYQLPETEAWTGYGLDPAPPMASSFPWRADAMQPFVAVVQYWDRDEEEARRLIEFLRANPDPLHFSLATHKSEEAGYPAGPNRAAMEIINNAREWWPSASGILLMEPDCVPVSPNWAKCIYEDWKRCKVAGCLVMGSYRPLASPIGHINGNLMFDQHRLPHILQEGGVCPDDKPWDTFYAPQLMKHGARTGLIRNLWKERWVPRMRMLKPECGVLAPVIIHGVKDEGAWDLAKENHK